jgi:hypothetical protein
MFPPNTIPVGSLIVINNNNNNNNIDHETISLDELVKFLGENQNLKLEDLLEFNSTKEVKEFIDRDKKEIDEFLKNETSKSLSKF